LEFLCQESAFVPYGQQAMSEIIENVLTLGRDEISEYFSCLSTAKGAGQITVDISYCGYLASILARGEASEDWFWVFQEVQMFLDARTGPDRDQWMELQALVDARSTRDSELRAKIRRFRNRREESKAGAIGR
jgi:hypothetical protein